MDETRKRDIGKNIRNLREGAGLSQRELADKLGKSAAAISQYESGETTPRVGVIEQLASIFHVRKSDITGWDTRGSLSSTEWHLIELFRECNDDRGLQVVKAAEDAAKLSKIEYAVVKLPKSDR